MRIVSSDCINRNHLIARCPACAAGILMVTCKDDFNGIAETNCAECNKIVAFYIVMQEHKVWILRQPAEMVSKRVT